MIASGIVILPKPKNGINTSAVYEPKTPAKFYISLFVAVLNEGSVL